MLSTDQSGETLAGMLFMEAFVSIHMSVFVLNPLARLFAKGDYKALIK